MLTWVWEKEQSHRLFNFSEGYKVLPRAKEIIGSRKYFCSHQKKLAYLFVFCLDVLLKKGNSDVNFQKASQFKEDTKKSDKLLNVVFDNGSYYLYEPGNPDKKSQQNIIENYPWLITRFMPSHQILLK